MKGCGALVATYLVLGSSAFASPSAQLDKRQSKTPAVTVQGNGNFGTYVVANRTLPLTARLAFFAGSSRFYIRGVDYQPGESSRSIRGPSWHV